MLTKIRNWMKTFNENTEISDDSGISGVFEEVSYYMIRWGS